MFLLHNYPRHLGHMVPQATYQPKTTPCRAKGIHIESPHGDEATAAGIFTHYSSLHMLVSYNQ